MISTTPIFTEFLADLPPNGPLDRTELLQMDIHRLTVLVFSDSERMVIEIAEAADVIDDLSRLVDDTWRTRTIILLRELADALENYSVQ